MENLEARTKVINLGRLFVQELKLEPGVDTFSRWISHYLAEKITLTEQTKGKEKEEAEKECYDLILKLWHHRRSIPNGRRPLQNFEPILDLLVKLNSEKQEPFFFNVMHNQELSVLEMDNPEFSTVERWINTTKEIDKIARIWIEYALSQAVSITKNERTKEWIDNAVFLSDNADTSIIKILLDNNPSIDIEDFDTDGFSKNYAVEKLKKRMDQLQKFAKLNEIISNAYESELKKLLD